MKSHEIHIELTCLNFFFSSHALSVQFHGVMTAYTELENKQWGWLSMKINSFS